MVVKQEKLLEMPQKKETKNRFVWQRQSKFRLYRCSKLAWDQTEKTPTTSVTKLRLRYISFIQRISDQWLRRSWCPEKPLSWYRSSTSKAV